MNFSPANRFVLPAGTLLHRIHARAFAPAAFNPCAGRPSRFAPLRRPDGSCIPTLYAAHSLECAVHETVFHHIPPDAARKTLDLDIIRALDHSILLPQRDLVLGALFEPDLNRWKLTRQDLIDTVARQYSRTAAWAIALHDAQPALDGLIWTSRRCDPAMACVLFGDRVGADGLQPQSRAAISATPTLLADIRGFGLRAGITLVV